MMKVLSLVTLLVVFSTSAMAVEIEDHDGMLMNHGDGHLMDMGGGMVMGQNADTLPAGCDKVSETKEITVHAGHKYAEKFPGRMFAFDTQELQFKPCTKLTVHFINDDNIRHQWMMHGLPKNLYNKGMFHLEISGPAKISGTLILPPGDKTYLVHCDIAQHMEKGMKAQLKVGKGDGDLPSIPGVTANTVADDYKATLPELLATAATVAATVAQQPVVAVAPKVTAVVPGEEPLFSGITVIGLAIGLLLAPFLSKKFKGMSASEAVAYSFELLAAAIKTVLNLLSSLIKLLLNSKKKILPGG
ncbi:MAG: copper oxidase [Methylococcales bacterium]